MLSSLLRDALEHNASDIFLSSLHKPAFKVLGKVQYQDSYEVLTESTIQQYIAELVGAAGIQNFQKEKDMDFSCELPSVGRFRVNISFTYKGAALVFRPIKEHVPALETLHLPMEEFLKCTQFANGIVLFTGTMGSGKSTSMASLLEYINEHQHKHIVTIEDPIEFIFESKTSLIDQREVPRHSHTFFRALRGSFREAVDVLLLGEMRDLETMSLAMTAAETGALVFATLHTAGAVHAIDRIIDAFPADRQAQVRVQLSQVLRCVVWQSLLPNKEGTGMVPAVEILFNNHAVAHLIRKGQTYQLRSVMETARKEGMVTMEKAVEELIEKEYITPEVGKEYVASLYGTLEQDEEL